MLVGRSEVVATIAEGLRTGGSPLAIVGAPGIGKTAVAEAAVGLTGLRAHTGEALPTLSHISYLPLKRALGIDLVGDSPAIAAKVASLVGSGVLVIEDLHWADEDTIAALPLLARRMRVLVTARSEDGTDPIRTALDASGCTTITLSPLAPDDARRLAGNLNPALSGPELDDVVRGARGNPLMIRALAESRGTNLADSVAARLEALTSTTRQTLEAICLLGRPVDASRVSIPIDELIGSGFMYQEDGLLRVEHDLIAQAIVESIDDERRVQLHAEIAERLDDPAEAAVHLAAAGRFDEAYRTAIEAMAETTQPSQRARLMKLAAQHAPEGSPAELQLDAAKALIDTGRASEGLEFLDRLQGGSPVERATSLHHRSSALMSTGRSEDAARAALDGLAIIDGDDPVLETRLRIRHAEAEVSEVPFGADMRGFLRLVDLARRNEIEVDRALRVAGVALMNAGEHGALGLLTESMQLAATNGSLINEFVAAVGVIQLFFTQKRSDDGRALALAMAWRAHSEDLGNWETVFRVEAVINHLITKGRYHGEVDELEELLDRGSPMGTLRPRAEGVLVACLAELGMFERARARFVPLDACAIGPRARAERASGLARYHWLHGDLRAVIEIAAEDLPIGPGRAVARLEADWARMELGIPVEHPETDPVLDYLETAYFERAALAAMTGGGPGDDPVEMFNLARSRWDGVWSARTVRCALGAGLALIRNGDFTAARTRLIEAEKIAEERGYEPLRRRIRKAAREAGLARPSRAPASGRITAREREVLTLVSAGSPTKVIAAELQIAPSTVETLIRNAMRKTGAATRLEAAAAVASEALAE